MSVNAVCGTTNFVTRDSVFEDLVLKRLQKSRMRL
jgi:hypothetical protein